MKISNKILKAVTQAGAMVTMIMGVGVSILLLIFVGVLGGQSFSMTQNQILAINETNPTIYTSIINGITSGFKALETVGSYLPLVVLAVIIGLVLSIILGFSPVGGTGGAL